MALAAFDEGGRNGDHRAVGQLGREEREGREGGREGGRERRKGEREGGRRERGGRGEEGKEGSTKCWE